MTISEALLELGATTELLSVEERERLDEDGYLYLPGILSPVQVAEFNCRLAELAAA
ncbi:MAG: phytanoyl-CoA dioxygenase, partial [Armatimonadetes bacterium]|nr:phytanoyl-CoA dioxygenase [Armatimonadota bacterium]